MIMNKDIFETQWVEIRDFLPAKFSKLTDEDIRQINGKYDLLVTKLQQRYGLSREEAEDEVQKWIFDKNARAFKQDKAFARTRDERRTDDSSLFKWLILAALPLLLLAGYLVHENVKTPSQDTVVSPTQTATAQESSRDLQITQNIRSALVSSGTARPALTDIRIETTNGIVTVSGSVPTTQERESIFQIIQNIAGVRQINDQLEVK